MAQLRETVGVREAHVNADEGYHLCEDTFCDDPYMRTTGEVYKFGVKEYGRCESKVYVDCRAHVKHHVGWVFVQSIPYEDTGDMFHHETWVTLYETIDGVRQPFYIDAPDYFVGC